MTDIEKLQESLRLLDKDACVHDISEYEIPCAKVYVRVLDCQDYFNDIKEAAREWRHALQYWWEVRNDRGVVDGFDAPRYCYEQKVMFSYFDILNAP